jgi:glycosyltransferase involved in cell wall biosynthesis
MVHTGGVSVTDPAAEASGGVGRRLPHVAQVFSHWGPDTANGVQRAVHSLSLALEASGHEVWRCAVEREGIRGIVGRRPDIVHLHSVHISGNILLGRRLRRAGIPYCVSTHGGLSPIAFTRGTLKKQIFKLLCERNYLNQAAFIHALTIEEAQSLRAYGVRSAITVAPNGVETTFTAPEGAGNVVYTPLGATVNALRTP